MSSATENQAQKRAHAEENGSDAVDAKSRKVENGQGKCESSFNKITTPEIFWDLFSFLDKDQIERIQLVNQFWNNVIIRHKNILPLRQFKCLQFKYGKIHLYATEEDLAEDLAIYKIKFDGPKHKKRLSKIEKARKLSSRYSQLTVDEVLTNLSDVIFDTFDIKYYKNSPNYLLNMVKFVTTKTGGRFRGRFGKCRETRFGSKLSEIFDNYIIVVKLTLSMWRDDYIREICANPEIVQLPSTPKEVRLACLDFKENDKVLNFTYNGKLNEANRLTIAFETSDKNYGNFIRQWFELYRTHQNPISLVGTFELFTFYYIVDSVHDAVKKFLNNTQLRVKYSLETKEFHRSTRFKFSSHSSYYGVINQYVKRSCVLHETDSYALVIEMEYGWVTDMSSINASDLDQPPCDKMKTVSFCVKSL